MITQTESGLSAAEYSAIQACNYQDVTYKVVAFRQDPQFAPLGAPLVGLAPFNYARAENKVVAHSANGLCYVFDLATQSWSNATAAFPSGEVRLVYSGSTLYAYTIAGNKVVRKSSGDLAQTWSSQTDVFTTLGGYTFTKVAVADSPTGPKPIAVLRDNVKHVNFIVQQSYTSGAFPSGIPYPYPINDIDADGDYYVLETEVAGPLSAEADRDNKQGRRYYEQVRAIVAFNRNVPEATHAEIDRVHRANNPDNFFGVRLSFFNNQYFASTYRVRGVNTALLYHVTEYQSWNGNQWSLGSILRLPNCEGAIKYFVSGDHIFALSTDGHCYVDYICGLYGEPAPQITEDITSRVAEVSYSREQMISANLLLANDDHYFDNHPFISSLNRVGFKLYAVYDGNYEFFLGTVYSDAQESQYFYQNERQIALSCRDRLAWMVDYYKSEDHRNPEPNYLIDVIGNYESPDYILFDIGQRTEDCVGYKYFAFVNSCCFPRVEFGHPSSDAPFQFFAFLVDCKHEHVAMTSNQYRKFVNGAVLKNGITRNGKIKTYYACVNDEYIIDVSSNIPVNGKYYIDQCPAIGGYVGLYFPTKPVSGFTHGDSLQNYLNKVGGDKFVYEVVRTHGYALEEYPRPYAAFARLKSTLRLSNLSGTRDVIPPTPLTIPYRGAIQAANQLTSPLSGSVVIDYDDGNAVTRVYRFPAWGFQTDFFKARISESGGFQPHPNSVGTYNNRLTLVEASIAVILQSGQRIKYRSVGPGVQPGDTELDLYAFVHPKHRAIIQFVEIEVTARNYSVTVSGSAPYTYTYSPTPSRTIECVLLEAKQRDHLVMSRYRELRGTEIGAEYALTGSEIDAAPRQLLFTVGHFKSRNDNYPYIAQLLLDYRASNDATLFQIVNNGDNGWTRPTFATTAAVSAEFVTKITSYAHQLEVNPGVGTSNTNLPGVDQSTVHAEVSRTGFAHVLGVSTFNSEAYIGNDFDRYANPSTRDIYYVTLDAGEAPMSGLERAIDGRYLTVFSRYNGDIMLYQFQPQTSRMTLESPVKMSISHDARELPSHIRMLGADAEAEYVDEELLSLIGHRFAEVNNPYLLSEDECLYEAKRVMARLKQEAVKMKLTLEMMPMLEPEDRVTVEGMGDWIVEGYTATFENGGCYADYELRQWVEADL